MEIIRNEAIITRYRRISQFASLFGLTILGAGLFLSLQNNPQYFFAQWATLLVGIVMWQVSMNFAYKYARSPRPDEQLDEALSGTTFKSYLYHYVVPAQHVLLTRSGPIVLVPKTQTGTIIVSGDDGSRWIRKGSMFKRFFGQEPALGSPTREAKAEIGKLVAYIKENAPELDEVPIGAIVVFVAPMKDLKLDTEASQLPVVHANALKKYLRKQLGRPLPPEQFQALRNIFAAPLTDADDGAFSAETS